MRNLEKRITDIIGKEINNTLEAPPKALSISDLMKIEFPPVNWIVDKLVPRNGITALSGKPKIGKSFLSLNLALSVASGQEFLGQFQTEQGAVLIISKEDPLWLIQKRIRLLRNNFDLPIYFRTDPDLFLDTDKSLEELKKFIEENNIKLIIIDSFRRIFRGEENSSQVIAGVHNGFKKLQSDDLTILFIHHHGKEGYFVKKDAAEKLRGSSDILAMIDSLLILESKEESILKLTNAVLRDGKPLKPFLLEFPNEKSSPSEFKFLDYMEPEVEKKAQAKSDIHALLEVEGEKYQQQIIEALRSTDTYSSTTIKEALSQKQSERRSIYNSDPPTPLFDDPDEKAVKTFGDPI